MEVEFYPGQGVRIELECDRQIAANLVNRAAEVVMEASGIQGHVRFRLRKQIPMGGGLGGGSTDAAAVLLCLPVLAGRSLPMEQLLRIGAELGSDVPFFLLGGTALGLGRGTELYPIPDVAAEHVVLLTPEVHSQTAAAYAGLRRTAEHQGDRDWCALASQAIACGLPWAEHTINDFEEPIFSAHPQLGSLYAALLNTGARPARMTGSGASLFGVYPSAEALELARAQFSNVPSLKVRFVPGGEYRAMWAQQLGEHVRGTSWPPVSKYVA